MFGQTFDKIAKQDTHIDSFYVESAPNKLFKASFLLASPYTIITRISFCRRPDFTTEKLSLTKMIPLQLGSDNPYICFASNSLSVKLGTF